MEDGWSRWHGEGQEIPLKLQCCDIKQTSNTLSEGKVHLRQAMQTRKMLPSCYDK